MTQDSKRVAVGEDREDRISDLPRGIIDGILELLPVEDASRTSVLSKKWRDIWVKLPYLRLDKIFCHDLAVKSQSVFKETVDEILLQHIGDIVKFVLDVSETNLSSYADIDRWMRYVTRNGVKELTLIMIDNTAYKLPSYIFNCPTLTYLLLCNSLFKPPNSFLGFQNLIDLYLYKTTFVPTQEFCVINVPRLVNLTMMYCKGTEYLNIISPQLDSLVVRECHCRLLNCFMNCKKLVVLELLEFDQVVERATLEKLLFSLPTLEILHLGSVFLEILSADTVSKGPLFTLNCLWQLSLSIDFGNLSQISCAIQLIQSFPDLSKLHIFVYATGNNAEAVKYLDTPACLDQRLDKLEYVSIKSFECSQTELLFVKLLCARAPSLVRMCIDQEPGISSKEERNIAIELMRFPRASPVAELFYFPSAP